MPPYSGVGEISTRRSLATLVYTIVVREKKFAEKLVLFIGAQQNVMTQGNKENQEIYPITFGEFNINFKK